MCHAGYPGRFPKMHYAHCPKLLHNIWCIFWGITLHICEHYCNLQSLDDASVVWQVHLPDASDLWHEIGEYHLIPNCNK